MYLFGHIFRLYLMHFTYVRIYCIVTRLFHELSFEDVVYSQLYLGLEEKIAHTNQSDMQHKGDVSSSWSQDIFNDDNMSFVSSPIGSSRPGAGSNPTPGPMLKLMSNETVGGTTDQSLNCPICQLHLRNPRVLPCLHSFCLRCLQMNVGQSRHFPCPVCRLVRSF